MEVPDSVANSSFPNKQPSQKGLAMFGNRETPCEVAQSALVENVLTNT